MNGLIFSVTLKDARVLLAALAIAMAALQMLIGSTYQAFHDVASQVVEQMPRELAALIKMQPGVALSGSADHYVSLGWYHPLFLVLGCAVAIASNSAPLLNALPGV